MTGLRFGWVAATLFLVSACGSPRSVDRHGNPVATLPFPAVIAEFDGVLLRASRDPAEPTDEPLAGVLVDVPAALQAIADEVDADLVHRVSNLVHTRVHPNAVDEGRVAFPKSGRLHGLTMWLRKVGDLRLVAHEFAHILDHAAWNGLDIRSLPHVPAQFEGPDVNRSEPAGVNPTRYSRQDVQEWFCEVYGSLFALANQLSGPLVRHREALNGPALVDIADSLNALGLLRQESAAFVRRYFDDARLRADVDALRRVSLSSDYASFIWRRSLLVDSISRSQWRASSSLPDDGPVLFESLADRQYQQAQDAARRVLFQVLWMAQIDPVRLAQAANRLASSGKADEARSLVDAALRLTASCLQHPEDHSARSACEAFAASVPSMPDGESRYQFQLLSNHVDTNCFAGAASILRDVDEQLLGSDPKPRLRWLLARIRPTTGFVRYVEAEGL